MRMTKFLLALVCLLALSACGPEHKSVLEPLTPEEADELAGKYEHFINIYERVIFPKVDKLPEHSLFRQKLEKLTYGDFMEFYLLDKEEWEKRFSEEWKQRYDMNRLNQQVDSIVVYWKSRYPGRLPTSNIGKPLDVDMPNSVYDYLMTLKDSYREWIIKDLIDETFENEIIYVGERVMIEKYKYNPLAYTLLHGEPHSNYVKEKIESENK